MPLQVWLPLTGDTTNRGIADWIFSVSNTSYITVDNAGKIGKCYNFNSSATNKGIYADDNGFMSKYINYKSWSLCTWVNVASTVSITCVMGISYGLRIYVGSTSANTYVVLSNSERSVSCGSDVLVNDGNWHHIAVTYDSVKNTINFYVDGVSRGTQSYTSGYTYYSSWSNGLFIGRDPNKSTVSDNYLFKGKMNDVRIYDHALSPKEISDISKAKVIHYPLNTGGGLSNLTKRVLKSSNPTAYLAYQINLSENLTANTTYTIQFWDIDVSHTGKTASTLGIAVYWGGGNIRLVAMLGTSYFTNGHADYISVTFTVTESQASGSGSSNLWLNIYNSPSSASGTMNMSIGKWKLEKGDTATPWVPNSADTEYIIMGYENKIVYDTSGCQLNGTSANAIVPVAGSPRNSVAMKFNGTSDKITLTRPFESATRNPEMTFAFWIKRNSYTDATQRSIYYGICHIYLYTDYKFRINWVHATSESSSNNTWACGLLVPADEWHHVCFTFKSGVIKVYYDGELYNSDNRSSTGQFMGGARFTTQDLGHAQFGGSLSDFRVYATALSADDVLALYNTPVSIADSGTMLTQGEFIEK